MNKYEKECPNPKCRKIITFTRKSDLLISISNNSKCKACASKNTQFKKGCKSLGISPITYWKNTLSNKEANKKIQEFKNKQSILHTGSKNSMYGKPSPQGSGNGWSGWYKGWFFRSLLELSYLVNVIERFGFKWETGESKKWKIQYKDYTGQIRNYFPDFILNDKYIIECKPKRLYNSPKVLAKKQAAIEFCRNFGYRYKLVTCQILKFDDIDNLIKINSLKFTDKYEQKYKQYRESHSK